MQIYLLEIREGYSNRIFFLTDLEVSSNDGNQFKASVVRNSSNNLWSTVVGIGLDLTQVFYFKFLFVSQS